MPKKTFKVINDSAIQLGKTTINGNDLVENLYDSLGQYILTGKVTNESAIGKVLYKQLKSIDSKLKDSDNLKNVKDLMDITKETSNYYLKKQAQDADFTEYLLFKNLFQWQRNVWNSSSKRKALICGRRSGKSFYECVEMLKHCVSGVDNVRDEKTGLVTKKYRQAIYIGLTAEKAASVMWQPIKDLIEKCHIPYSRIDNSLHEVIFTNGNSLRLVGNNSAAEREKLRGADYSLAILDEAQSQKGLAYLLESIIGPIITGRNGVIVISGTAPISAGTYWEGIIQGDHGYEVFKATMADNPSIPDCDNALQRVLEENHWDENNITFRREYLGEICYDTECMIYPIRYYYDNIEAIPRQSVKNIFIGVDYGWTDKTAFAPIVQFENGDCYLVDEFKMSKMSASDIIHKLNEVVERLSRRYNFPYERIEVRTDNSAQNINNDISNQYPKMSIRCANKRDEKQGIALVNDMLLSGQLKLLKGGFFDDECNRLVWKVNDNGTIRYGEVDDETFHGDICDSVRYAVSSLFRENSFTTQV